MARKKKLYYLPTYGQLGNWLSVLAHLVAFSLDYDFQIVLFKQEKLYSVLKNEKKLSHLFRFTSWLSNKIFSFAVNSVIKYSFNKKNKYFLDILVLNQPFKVENNFKNKIPNSIITTNWLFRYNEGVIKHQNEIRNILAFDDSTFTKSKEILKLISTNYLNHTIVGIHVRRGDYATWLDGKYFYDNSTYYAKMKSLAEQLEKCVFIVCSNEDFVFENEANLTIFYTKGSPAEDIFILSKCKYITGPVSTFSSYAAFLGDQYLLLLESKDDDVNLNRFSKYYL